jgi:hypothetical protein
VTISLDGVLFKTLFLFGRNRLMLSTFYSSNYVKSFSNKIYSKHVSIHSTWKYAIGKCNILSITAQLSFDFYFVTKGRSKEHFSIPQCHNKSFYMKQIHVTHIKDKPTYFMFESIFWENNEFFASQEMHLMLLFNPKARLIYLQYLATYTYSKPDQSSPRPQIMLV